jgi:hypothetical protein
VTAIRRLQPFRYLHDCSDCFRLERIAGWALHLLESAAFSRRTPILAVGWTAMEPRRLGAPEIFLATRCRRVAQETVIRADWGKMPTPAHWAASLVLTACSG